MTDRLSLEALETLSLAKGAHDDRSNGLCVMEVAAWVAGEPHSDAPECACQIIAKFLINWNDTLPTDEDRTRLLKPLVPLVVGTRSTKAVELRRSWMAFDWLVREHAPAWMDLTPALKPHADALRGLGEIVDAASYDLTMPVLSAAQKASAAAWDAARAAALDAALDAARAAALDAALDAARAAALDAALDAARAALAPTTARLQASAQDLVRRMCAVTP